jgi:hypothetical protein
MRMGMTVRGALAMATPGNVAVGFQPTDENESTERVERLDLKALQNARWNVSRLRTNGSPSDAQE